MTLALPTLDSRTYDELVREGERVIPRRAPEWTDHNAHDPGITLIELFSWLIEQDIYRLDRIPDASVRAFLKLVGIVRQPPQLAHTVIELTPHGGGPLDVPSGLQLTDAAGSVTFETQSAVHLTAAKLVLIKAEIGGGRYDCATENAAGGALYSPFGAQPVVGNDLLLGFDAPLGEGGATISLYLWGADPERDAQTRQQLVEEEERERARHRHCAEVMSNTTRADWRQHYSACTVWEYFTPAGTWAALDSVEDETRGLTLSGFVRFRVPADHAPSTGSAGSVWSVRCRLASGRYECPPAVARIAVNAVSAHHAALEPDEALGVSQGHAAHTFALAYAPVVAGSAELHVVLDGGDDETWREAAEWDCVGPHDRTFRLDAEGGRIEFGDGRVGRVPPAGAKIVCSYRSGGGTEGNIGAGTLSRCSGSPVDVLQPFRAFGGAAAETLDDARGRALAFLARRARAVTLDDFETLACSTPGVPVARARALTGYHPSLPCVSATGNVTVVVVPSCPRARPEPGPDFLAAVYRWLAPRCVLTTELHVIRPSYRVVAVHARLHAEPAVNTAALAEKAEAALNRFLHPLDGGPDGTGWPVGRAVYRAEVLAVLNGIEGVAYVDELRLVDEDETAASCANVPLCPEELVSAGTHRIRVIARRPPR